MTILCQVPATDIMPTMVATLELGVSILTTVAQGAGIPTLQQRMIDTEGEAAEEGRSLILRQHRHGSLEMMEGLATVEI